MFRVGMKVTPKNADPWPWEGDGEIYPQYGTVYTVRASEFIDDEQYIWLAEIESAPRQYSDEFGERSFAAEDFRPVTSPKQEVSFTTGAPVDSERWDNRVKRRQQKAITAIQS